MMIWSILTHHFEIDSFLKINIKKKTSSLALTAAWVWSNPPKTATVISIWSILKDASKFQANLGDPLHYCTKQSPVAYSPIASVSHQSPTQPWSTRTWHQPTCAPFPPPHDRQCGHPASRMVGWYTPHDSREIFSTSTGGDFFGLQTSTGSEKTRRNDWILRPSQKKEKLDAWRG